MLAQYAVVHQLRVRRLFVVKHLQCGVSRLLLTPLLHTIPTIAVVYQLCFSACRLQSTYNANLCLTERLLLLFCFLTSPPCVLQAMEAALTSAEGDGIWQMLNISNTSSCR